MDGWGNRLKLLAKQGFGGVGKLAALLGMSSPHLSQYIAEENSPKLEFFEKLAKLGANVNWLLTGIGNMMLAAPAPIEQRVGELEKKVLQLSGDKKPWDDYPGGREAYEREVLNVGEIKKATVTKPQEYKYAATPKRPRKRKDENSEDLPA